MKKGESYLAQYKKTQVINDLFVKEQWWERERGGDMFWDYKHKKIVGQTIGVNQGSSKIGDFRGRNDNGYIGIG